MQCIRCGGKLRPDVLEHYERWPKEVGLIVFENIPVDECVECGEVYFSAKVSEMMEKVIEKRSKPVRSIKVPVYSLPKMAAG